MPDSTYAIDNPKQYRVMPVASHEPTGSARLFLWAKTSSLRIIFMQDVVASRNLIGLPMSWMVMCSPGRSLVMAPIK